MDNAQDGGGLGRETMKKGLGFGLVAEVGRRQEALEKKQVKRQDMQSGPLMWGHVAFEDPQAPPAGR